MWYFLFNELCLTRSHWSTSSACLFLNNAPRSLLTLQCSYLSPSTTHKHLEEVCSAYGKVKNTVRPSFDNANKPCAWPLTIALQTVHHAGPPDRCFARLRLCQIYQQRGCGCSCEGYARFRVSASSSIDQQGESLVYADN